MSADFTPEKEDYKILTPFKMQVLTNFPYIEADFDALTNYQLLCKIVEYLNGVIANENELTEQVTSLYNAYVSLQNYVNNYFDNLDIQEEINKKLDEMASDGTLLNLIKGYIDPIYQAYESRINETVEEQNQAISVLTSTTNSKLLEQDAKIEAVESGSPLVASSIDDMTETDRVYVNTTDGNWYYYDGDSWEIGGTYQSTAIGEGEVELINLSNTLKSSVNGSYPEINKNNGYYIASWGSLAESSSYCYTDGIYLNKGDTIIFNASGVANNVVILAKKLNPTSYTPIITATDNSIHEFNYTATVSGYFYISSNKNNLSNIAIYRKNYSTNEMPLYYDEIKSYDSPVIYNETNTDNLISGYIKYNTGVETSDASLYCTDFLEVYPNNPIELYSGGNNLSAYSIDGGLCFYDENKVFISGTKIPVDTKIDTTIPVNAKYVRFTITYLMRLNGYELFYKSLSKQLENINKRIQQAPNYIEIFHKIGVIGDSLSSGEIAYGESPDIQYIDKYDYSWLSNIARINGLAKEHFSAGGVTAKSWLTSTYKTEFLDNSKKCNAYIIALGTNDRYASYGLGTINDSAGDDSFVGYYKEIIELIQTTYPNSAIFLLSLYNPAGNSYSEMIDDIADLYDGVYYLDYVNNSNIYTTTPNYSINGHYNTQGYVYVSEVINDLINKVVQNNMNDFKYFAINN